MILRNIFIFIYLFITVLLFSTFEATLELWLAFFGNAVLLTFITFLIKFVFISQLLPNEMELHEVQKQVV